MAQSSAMARPRVDQAPDPSDNEIVVTGESSLVHGPSGFQIALADIGSGIKNYYLWSLLGWLDIRQRYRRSALGPFWLTISMGVTVSALGMLYSLLFKMKTADLLPWVTSGFIVWGFISGTLVDACNCFMNAEGVIKQVHIPLSLQPLRVIWRNLIMMAHNIVILPIVYVVFGLMPTNALWLAIPGMVLLVLNLCWISLLLGMVCTRFRDLPQLVNSILQIAFYVIPIIWKPDLLPVRWHTLLTLNPFYHLLSVVRDPLLGIYPTTESWLVSLGGLVFGALLTMAVYGRFHRRVAYWL